MSQRRRGSFSSSLLNIWHDERDRCWQPLRFCPVGDIVRPSPGRLPLVWHRVGNLGAPCRGAEQPWHAGLIVGRHGEGDLPVDLGKPAEADLAQPGHRVGPAEGFLGPLADALAEGVAGITGRPPVDRRAPPVGVLRQVRSDIDLAQPGGEGFVRAQGDSVRSVGMQLDQVQRGVPLGVAGGALGDRAVDQAAPVLHEREAHEASLAALPGHLRNSPASRWVVEAWVSVLRFWPR